MPPTMLKSRSETKTGFWPAFSGMSLVVLAVFAFVVFLWVLTFAVRLIVALIGLAG